MKSLAIKRWSGRLAALTAVGGVVASVAVSGSEAKSTAYASAMSASASRPNIGVINFDTTVPYISALAHAEEAAGPLYGANMDVQNGQNNVATEVGIVQQFIVDKKSAIIVTTATPSGLAPIVKAAAKAGIPVIATGIQIPDAPVVTYVGTNDYTYGQYLGQATCQAIHGKGNVAIILGVLGSSPEYNRLAGIKEYFDSHCPKIKIVAQQAANWDNAQALAVGENFLSKYPKGTLQAVIDEGPEGTSPAAFSKKDGRTDVKWIVGDVSTAVAGAIRSGSVTAAVFQNAANLADYSVRDAVDWVEGKRSDVKRPNDYIPLKLITKANLGTITPF